eukprot:873559-Amphidinium_carterae.1
MPETSHVQSAAPVQLSTCLQCEGQMCTSFGKERKNDNSTLAFCILNLGSCIHDQATTIGYPLLLAHCPYLSCATLPFALFVKVCAHSVNDKD